MSLLHYDVIMTSFTVEAPDDGDTLSEKGDISLL